MIYRSEEWVKVLIHELFHIFSFDFHEHRHLISKVFTEFYGIKSNYLLSESIVEFWSRVLNCGFVSFLMDPTSGLTNFSLIFNLNYNMEMMWSIQQSSRLLAHYNLTYRDIINKNSLNIDRFSEKTNAFNYIVVVSILMMNFDTIMDWLMTNNNDLFNFEKDENSMLLFLALYKSLYKSDNVLHMFDQVVNLKTKGFMFSLF